jgi:diguanylate cyclase (GGDEF)-like protein
MAEPRPPADPVLDIRVRWRAGQVLLSVAAASTLIGLLRPLSAPHPAWLAGGYALLLSVGVVGSALLASLRGSKRPEAIALQAFLVLSLDGVGQLVAPAGLPIWPLMTLLVASQAIAEGLTVALGFALQASLLAAAAAAWAQPPDYRSALVSAFGYVVLALATNRALLGEKKRLSATLGQLARLKHGIDQLEDEPGSGAAPLPGPAEALRQVTGDARRARQLDRAGELDDTLRQLLHVAQQALDAHALLYFDLDPLREQALLRASRGPDSLLPDCAVPLASDPFSFLVARAQPFYATDFKRLLWELPWYRAPVKIGTLMAVPVQAAEVTVGALVADKLEIQAFTGREPGLLSGFAALAGEALQRTRGAHLLEEQGAEFKAVHPVSKRLATLSREPEVRDLLLRSARQLVGLEGAAVVMSDAQSTRYVVEAAFGWPSEYLQRTVGLDERTWAAWVLRSAEEAYLLDNLAGHETRMPILVLDEGTARGESLLAVPLRAEDRNLGALVLTGPRGAFDASSRRVLDFLANQAAATLSLIGAREQQRQLAVRDGLTNLYNRRAFNELLAATIAGEDRRTGGRLGLVLLDIDHFKKLNDTYGHQAGDAALRSLAGLLRQHLRKGDQAARYGGEEFVVVLPGSDEERALQAAERLREALQKHRFVHDGARIPLSASFGVAIWPTDGKEPEALLAAADRSLYAAKQAGRNRVVAAATLPAAPAAGS